MPNKRKEVFLKDKQIEKILEEWVSSDSSEDEETNLDYVPKSIDVMLDKMQGLSNQQLINILEDDPCKLYPDITEAELDEESPGRVPFYTSSSTLPAPSEVPAPMVASTSNLPAPSEVPAPMVASTSNLPAPSEVPAPMVASTSNLPAQHVVTVSTVDEVSTAHVYSSMPSSNVPSTSVHPHNLTTPIFPTYAELQARNRSWTTNVEHFEDFQFNKEMEPTKLYNHRSYPIEYFNNLFPEEIFEMIVTNTNKYAALKRTKFWTETNVNEIKAFLAIIILMGISPQSNIELYWSSDPFYNNVEISKTMTCKKFKKILENIHVCDVSTHLPQNHREHDKLQKIRPLLTYLNRTFQENATNSQTQSVDESMVKFKGRDSKKQYMPLKPIKRGFKVWCRCDSKTGYLYQCDIYTGKDTEHNEEGLGYRVVMKLADKLPRNTLLAFDNFFSSVALMETLYFRGILAIGTVRMQRKGLPKDLSLQKPRTVEERRLVKETKLDPGEFTYRFCHPCAVIKWRDTKDVYVISTAVSPIKVEIIQRTQKNGEKKNMFCPSAIAEYTRNMGGVDHFDHFRSSYSIGRRSKKTWFRLFWFLFESALINSYILYIHKNDTRKNIHRDFRLRVARSLKAAYVSTKKSDPILYKNKKGGVFGVPDEVRMSAQGHFLKLSTYKRCRFCSTRKTEKRSKYICEICKVPLCVDPCMKAFHQAHSGA